MYYLNPMDKSLDIFIFNHFTTNSFRIAYVLFLYIEVSDSIEFHEEFRRLHQICRFRGLRRWR